VKFNALRDFLAVSERGGLRAAARHLGLPQPAITRSIQELERELGVALFERHAKGVRLTPMGSAFLRRASAVRSELQRARDEIDQLRGETHGRITVCLSSAPHMALLPPVLRPFRARYPNVRMEIIDAVFPIAEAALRDGSADVYIGPTPPVVGGDLQVEKLFDNTRVILGRKGHPLAAVRSLRGLVDAEWVTTSITHKAEEELGPLFTQHGLPPPRLVLRAQSSLTFLSVLSSSDLLLMAPIQWLQFPPARDVLQQIKVAEPLPAPPICIVQRTGLPLTPAAEYFCDLVRRASAHRDKVLPKRA
jgi:LysR family transcriptional regulator of abg operon